MGVLRRLEVVATPVITASAAYATGNALGGLLTFSTGLMGPSTILEKVVIIDKANQKAAMDIMIFNQSFTPTTDKTAINISAADALNLQCHANLLAADYATIGTAMASCTHLFNGNLGMISLSPDAKLYAQLICRGTPTYLTTGDLIVKLGLQVWLE